jgi:5-methyltetrahydrofolate--homocysteine methyltransferase
VGDTSLLIKRISEAVKEGNVRRVSTAIKEAADNGITAQRILDEGLLDGLSVLSIRFRNSEVFITELLQSSKAMNVGLELIKDQLSNESARLHGRVIIATVEGDLHDIGKNLVKFMLEGIGCEVIDLGADITTKAIVDAVREYSPDIVALSALLTTTMIHQKEVISALKAAGLRDKVKVIVGGAPITKLYSNSIGADGYAEDATRVIALVKQLLEAENG